jgi:hypothetical protein
MAGTGAFKNQFGVSSENQRPRRPSGDTLAYIKSLPLDIQKSAEEVELFLSSKSTTEQSGQALEDDHYPQLFAAALSAIDEIRSEIASLAGDDDGSQCLEILARITAPYSELAARKLLMGCSGYYLHLSTHRYGSHVVQTILQLATSFSDKADLAEHILEDQYSTEEQSLPLLSDLILGLAEELTPHALQLAIHVCGSHVLRTLLCVLAGIDLLASPGNTGPLIENGNIRRGRMKNKKKKKKKPAPESTPSHAGLMHMVYRKPSELRIKIDDSFRTALDTLCEALAGSHSHTPGELQKLASHPSAGPLLIILLRVLTYVSCPDREKWQQYSEGVQDSIGEKHLGVHPPQPRFQLGSSAHKLAMKILCWPENESLNESESYVSDIIYGLAGEPRGSHMLETLLRLSPGPFYESLINYGDFYNRSTLQEYIDDPVSNFVVQTLLNTIQTKEQAETMLKAISPIISSGSVIDPAKKRRGILWRAVELASTFRVGQDGILKAIRLGFIATVEGVESQKDSKGAEKKKGRRKASAIDFPGCIPKLLDAKLQEGRVLVDVSGARTVHFLLRFAPRLCEDTLNGILNFSPEMLVMLARDGLASRCVWDGILEGPTENPAFSRSIQELREKLSGQWAPLGCDRVGQHVVKKIFKVLPEKEKLNLVEELSHGIIRLGGSAMGRSVIDACAVRQFTEGIEAWKHAIKKASMQEEWLKEMLGGDKAAETEELGRKRSNSTDDKPGKKLKKRAASS